jgi:predicted secreted Zn-dependent protease
MKNSIKTIMAALLVTGTLTINASAATTAAQTVTYAVSAINELSVSGATASVTVNSATAGSAPSVATDASTSYAITTNETGRKITGSLDTSIADAGVTLSVTLAAPAGASSSKQPLSITPVDLVTGISTLNQSSLGITYELAATSAAGVVTPKNKTVTLTITAGA